MNSADYKAEFRVEKADFASLQMPYKFLQCFIANREAFVMVWKDLVCCSEEQVTPADSAMRFNVFQYSKPIFVLQQPIRTLYI